MPILKAKNTASSRIKSSKASKKTSIKRTFSANSKKNVRQNNKKKLGLLASFSQIFHPQITNKNRAKLLHPEALFYLIGVVVGIFALVQMFRHFPMLKDGVLGFASNITPNQIIDQTNQERAKLGLLPLKVNDSLNQAALAKAQDMFNRQYWAHNAPDGTNPWSFIKSANYSYILAGENLARDFATTPEMVSAWMASPTHRANIVNGKYEEIGIAVVDGVLDGFETTLVVQMFGTPRSVQAVIPQELEDLAQKNIINIEPDRATVDEDNKELVAFIAQNNQQQISQAGDDLQRPMVLAGALVPVGRLTRSPLFTPLQITKALFLSVIMLIVFTLFYDGLVFNNKQTKRLVGQNLAHILFLATIAFLLIFFKGGMIG